MPAAQTSPHPLQFESSLVMSVSQPSAAVQSANPGWQVNPQPVPEQVGVAFGGVAHTTLHPPQLCTSLDASTSHPSAAKVLQS